MDQGSPHKHAVNTPPVVSLWAVEYSPSQRSCQVDQVGRVIQRNVQAMAERRASDWALLALSETHEAAERFADGFETRVTGRRPEAPASGDGLP